MVSTNPGSITRRVLRLIALSLAGGVAMAGPMIYSEIHSSPGIWGMRVVVGLICGAIGAPMLVAAAWRKRMVPAWTVVFIPPTAAAVLAAISWSDDYSFSHVAVPLSFVTVPIAFVLLPDRHLRGGWRRCPTCDYDLRMNPDGPCPECGGDPRVASRRPAQRRTWLINLAWLLAAMVFSGTGNTLFLRGILSLG